MSRLLNHSQLALVLLGFFTGVFFSALLPPAQPLLQFLPPTQIHSLNNSVQSVFSPGAAPVILSEISQAQQTLDIQLYQFSYPQLRQALAQAASRGVQVRILLEPRVESNLDTAVFLKQNNVSVRWASREYRNTHSKTMVVDGKRVLVGSINWSRNAMQYNREAAVMVESLQLAKEFLSIFEEDWQKATEVIAG